MCSQLIGTTCGREEFWCVAFVAVGAAVGELTGWWSRTPDQPSTAVCQEATVTRSLTHSLTHPPLSHKGCFTYSGRHTFEIFKLTIFLGTNRFVFICFTAKLTSASDEPTTITCFSVKKKKKTGQTLQSDQVRPLQGQELKNFERHQ